MSAVPPWRHHDRGPPLRQGQIGAEWLRPIRWRCGWRLVTTLAMTVAGRELATVLPVFVVMIMRSGIALCLLAGCLPVVSRRAGPHPAAPLAPGAQPHPLRRTILLVLIIGDDPDRAGYRHRVHHAAMDGAARRRLSRREADRRADRRGGARPVRHPPDHGAGGNQLHAGQAVALAAAMLLGSAIIIIKCAHPHRSGAHHHFLHVLHPDGDRLPAATSGGWPPPALALVAVVGVAGTFAFRFAKAISSPTPRWWCRWTSAGAAVGARRLLFYKEGVTSGWRSARRSSSPAMPSTVAPPRASAGRLDPGQRPEQPEHQDDHQNEAGGPPPP